MADVNTGGGPAIGGDVSIKGGDFAGRDKIEQKVEVHVERDSLDDLRTDIHLIKHDIEGLKFGQYEMRSDIKLAQAQHARSEPQAALNENIVRLIAVFFSVIVAFTFVLLLYTAWRELIGH